VDKYTLAIPVCKKCAGEMFAAGGNFRDENYFKCSDCGYEITVITEAFDETRLLQKSHATSNRSKNETR